MTKQQAERAVALLLARYPDARVESESDLEADDDDDESAADDFSVVVNEVVADTIDELTEQLEEDFGADPAIERLKEQLEALA